MTSQLTIRNFHQVTDCLYRGGQPNAEQLAQLKDIGITTIVSLRSGSVGACHEASAASALGICFIHIPFTYFKMLDTSAIQLFFHLLDQRPKQKIFVHCLHGVDRTGFLIATFRITCMGWNASEAYNEMRDCGFQSFRLPHFKWELWKYAKHSASLVRGNDYDSSTKPTLL